MKSIFSIIEYLFLPQTHHVFFRCFFLRVVFVNIKTSKLKSHYRFYIIKYLEIS